MLTTLILMALFEPLGHDCDLDTYNQPFCYFRYSKVSPKWQVLGILLLQLKKLVLGTPYPVEKGYNVFFAPI